ncbi:ubiquitin-like domain-containing protein [Paenibacillus sp. GYB003]|uniref:ubiquitin-like domain-containing protein n=1 Tax=Paenibacillus sp. GYB003 TaxID=2994392 RepID=UPI002F96BE44
MGVIPTEETHVKRSSSMSFAMRWKHENLRPILLSALFSIVMAVMFALLLYGISIKQVELVVGGETKQFKTRQSTLSAFLAEQQIAVGEYDKVSAAMDAKLKHGDKFVIERAVPVQLTADGKTETRYTVAKTVEGALEELQVELGELDKLTPAKEEPITFNTPIQIVRVQKLIEEQTEPIPFDTVKKNDPNLLKGKEQVVTEGKEGVLEKTVEKVFEDGQLVAENVVDTKVAQESVNQIVALGTKNPVVVLSAASPNIDEVTKGDVKFAYKQILNNVTLTAYSIDPKSTGKTSDHPQYGITASGTKVSEGRTIAVDPKVIPIGWWVYIEGIGLRRAEDTGSAVKGNIIDVYFENPDYAKRFGMKRGYKVYVIGKEKPTAN